jgi:hypothetical protein
VAHGATRAENKPDFSGFWEAYVDRKAPPAKAPPDLPEGWRTLFGLRGQETPSFQPWVLEATKKQRAVEEAAVKPSDGIDPQTAACTSAGMPDFMIFPEPYDIVQRPDEIVIDVERERTLPRHVYILPFHKAAKDYEDVGLPNPNGRSLAHWEGGELVVETNHIDAEPWLLTFDRVPHSPDISVLERIHLDQKTGRLVDIMTITDPKALAKPWTLKLEFRKLPPGTEMIPAICVPVTSR